MLQLERRKDLAETGFCMIMQAFHFLLRAFTHVERRRYMTRSSLKALNSVLTRQGCRVLT